VLDYRKVRQIIIERMHGRAREFAGKPDWQARRTGCCSCPVCIGVRVKIAKLEIFEDCEVAITGRNRPVVNAVNARAMNSAWIATEIPKPNSAGLCAPAPGGAPKLNVKPTSWKNACAARSGKPSWTSA
jgi:hypothetical protein